jgi:ribulose-phosphate 3-epimerase
MKHMVAPSLLAADFNHLGAEVEMINRSEADWIHCDIMDGVFVPNLSFGLPIVEHVARVATKPLDVHLMIVHPDQYIQPFARAGASHLTVHWEACPHLHRTIAHIREEGMKAGVCLNPHTPVHLLEEILPDLDLVLIMSVNPGFGGQTFIETSLDKVKRLRELIDRRNPECLIEVDGGVNAVTGQRLRAAGADVLVAGSALFGATDPEAAIRQLKNL